MYIKVSIIVPSLNVCEYIRECMDSLLNQSLSDIEIICVDAGSNDGTIDILKSYADNDNRIQIINSPIRSYGYQMNLGVKASRGEYIAIVESDDFVDIDMMRYLYLQAKEFDVDVSKADFCRVNGGRENRKYNIEHIFSGKEQNFYRKKINGDELLFLHIFDKNLWNGIYRRKFLLDRKIKFNETPGAAFQDIGFQQQVHTLAESFVYGFKNVYYYRMDREESSSNQPGWIRYIAQELRFLESLGLSEQAKWGMHKSYVFARMALGFVDEMRRAIYYSDFSIKNADWMDDYIWLQEKFKKVLHEGVLTCYHLPRYTWEQLLLLVRSLQSFRDMLWYSEKIRESDRCSFLNSLTEDHYVIFGCGARGKSAAIFFYDNRKDVVAFTDNNRKLWGESFLGKPVLSPQEAVKKYDDCKFVIANKYYGEKIQQQLLKLGIHQSSMVFYNPI